MKKLKNRSFYCLSADCVVFGYADGNLKVALIKRKKLPFKGKWALPGGFVEGDETVEEGAARELEEETGIKDVYLEQVQVFSEPKRDPRGRVITVAFFALVDYRQYELVATEDAEKATWWPINDLPPLAFDHSRIFEKALDALRNAIDNKPIAFHLLPKYFRLTELQTLYEQIFDMEIDKRNFRKKVAGLPFIQSTGKVTEGGRHRPAQLYCFNENKYHKGGKK